jgi:S-adenosylmethionine:tRNA ribosyltransferase-isomerase
MRDLPGLLRAGDLLVVNDAATLPARLPWIDGARREVRLLGATEDGSWWAVLFGEGDWRTPTEHRPPPPAVAVGTTLALGDELRASVIERSPLSERLVRLRFSAEGEALWRAIYRAGRPVQYAHVAGPLALWHVQTRYAGRPWAVELPSAGRPLTWGLLTELRQRGVALAALTHAAGLSATGDPALDRALPLPERYEIPASTAEAVADARARGGRIVAVGTSVVRALEGCSVAHGGALTPGSGWTDLRVGPATRLRVVDGLLTGMHEPETSHFELLRAFAPPALLARAHAHAAASGYLGHEFGDASLILAA